MNFQRFIEHIQLINKSNNPKSISTKNWISKIYQYYKNLYQNNYLFFKYLKIKLKEIPAELLKKFNFDSSNDLFDKFYKERFPFFQYFNLEDLEVGSNYTSETISAISDNFNIQKGMYEIINRKNTYVIKASIFDSQNIYQNKWITKDLELEYILEQTKVNSGIIKNSILNNHILKNINNNDISNFYLFIKTLKEGKTFYTFNGIYKANAFIEQNKSIRLVKKDLKDLQEDLKRSIEERLQESMNNPLFEKFKIVEQKQRIGQSLFRELLISKYPERKCIVCNIYSSEHLIANHIKPFKNCNYDEAIDPYNGLLLCPDHNHLMDKGYLSFDEKGRIILSKSIDQKLIHQFRLDEFLDKSYVFDSKTLVYMEFHRKNVFKL